jgi:hypothetical protein
MKHCFDRAKGWLAFGALTVMTVSGGRTANAVTICHYPPGNPGNAQLTNVSSQSVPQHVAQHGDVVCSAGDTTCCVTPEHACTNLDSDPKNCGSCGNVCAGGTCVEGECAGAEVTCSGCNLDEPCGPAVFCGDGSGSCNCWVKADRSGCFCGPFDSCDNHPPCDDQGACPDGLTCIENCCGWLCYPACH